MSKSKQKKMLPKPQIKGIMKKLGIKKETNTVYFLSRLEGWISNNGNTTISLAKGINKILGDINMKEFQEAEELKKLNLKNLKNNLIEKYANEIVELYTQKEFGVRKISKILWENHKAKVSYSSIYRFLNEQNLIRKKGKANG